MNKERSVELINIAKIDLLKGRINADLDSLARILIANYDNKFDCSVESTSYEDSICPPNEIVDDIIEQMKMDFYAYTKEKIEIENYWGHIHQINMSTNTHNHGDSYVSAVLYVSVPVGSGKIVFRPRYNQYDNAAYTSSFLPVKGDYYMFPSYLDHHVTRHHSNEMRVSISFNFRKQ